MITGLQSIIPVWIFIYTSKIEMLCSLVPVKGKNHSPLASLIQLFNKEILVCHKSQLLIN